MTAIRYREFQGEAHIGEAMALLTSGLLDAVLVRAVMSREACQALTHNFVQSPARVRRADGVPGFILGTTHYGKSPPDYFGQCVGQRHAVDALFEGVSDPVHMAHQALREYLNATIRPSLWQGLESLHARAVEWLPDPVRGNEFMLLPHEDMSQVNCERNAGWEMQHAPRVLAINFYAEVRTGEGRLRIYDYAPDRLERERLGLQSSGYPYPPQSYEGSDFMDLGLESGDLAIIDGGMLHAVTRTSARRVVINGFLGQVGETEFAYWT